MGLLLLLLLAVLGVAGASAPLVPDSLSRFLPQGPAEWCLVALFHVSSSLAYTVLYSALEEDSPSLGLMLFVEAAPGGRTRAELVEFLTRRALISSRLDSAERGGLLAHDGTGKLVLTAKGARLVRLFSFSQRLLGMEKGG
jgi:hypothetical protein